MRFWVVMCPVSVADALALGAGRWDAGIAAPSLDHFLEVLLCVATDLLWHKDIEWHTVHAHLQRKTKALNSIGQDQ